MNFYLIFSYEHAINSPNGLSWWKDNCCGYTNCVLEAGRYSKTQAIEIVNNAEFGKEEAVLFESERFYEILAKSPVDLSMYNKYQEIKEILLQVSKTPFPFHRHVESEVWGKVCNFLEEEERMEETPYLDLPYSIVHKEQEEATKVQ